METVESKRNKQYKKFGAERIYQKKIKQIKDPLKKQVFKTVNLKNTPGET